MSGVAVRWAMRQRGLKPATKIVLWCLADHHNAKTGECFPMQETIAAECEMSRSTVNLHLAILEESGLVRRTNTIDSKTKRQRPTRYILAIEDQAVSENRTEAMSENRTFPAKAVSEIASGNRTPDPEPCPKNDESRVRKSDCNLGREPKEEEEETRASANSSQPSLFQRVMAAAGLNPSDIPSTWWMPPRAEIEVNGWRAFAPGLLTDDLIVQHVAESAARHTERASRPSAFERGLRALAATLQQPASPVVPFPAAGPPPGNRPHRQLTAEEFQAAVNRGFSGQ